MHTMTILAAICWGGGAAAGAEPSPPAKKADPPAARPLFDGKSLAGWKSSDYASNGKIYVEKGLLHLEIGEPFTGVTYTRPFPKIDYEVTVEVMRTAGRDFFCGMTFPAGAEPCTLIVGGWGGGIVGLSNVDGMDASENETSNWLEFESNRWYQIRLKVTKEKIEAWIDKKQVVDLKTQDRQLGIRWTCEPSLPFGIATWQTAAAYRNIQLRELKPEIKK